MSGDVAELVTTHRRNQIRYVSSGAYNWFCDCGACGGARSRGDAAPAVEETDHA